jgi:hypothetical protein
LILLKSEITRVPHFLSINNSSVTTFETYFS